MLAEDRLREGNLQGALDHLQDEVRKDPASAKLRVFLFQLLSVMGRWERALKQLNVVVDLDPETIAMVQTYGPALQCEQLRAEVFEGKRAPLFFGEPEEWMAHQLQALELTAKGDLERAQQVREKAFDDAPATPGTIDGEPFEWIADADSRLGPVLEAIVNGRYQWIPFHRLRALRVDEPTDLRDLVWNPVHLKLVTGAEIIALVPTRYPGSEAAEDSGLRLAKKTEWVEKGGDAFLGLGQRMLATNNGEYPLLAVREITLEPPTDG